jgi:hypothetical protein
LLAGANEVEAGAIKAGLEGGMVPDQLIKKLAPEAQGLIRRWMALRSAAANNEMSGREFAARWLSPAKLANKRLMRETLGVSEKTLAGTNWSAQRLGKALGADWMGFMEFAAEQMAKFQMQEGRLEQSKVLPAIFPEGFNVAGLEEGLAKFFEPMISVMQKIFNALKVRGFVGPEAEFTKWLDSLARRANQEMGRKPKKLRKPKQTKAQKEKEKAAQEAQEASELEQELAVDWDAPETKNALKTALSSLVKRKVLDRNDPVYQSLAEMLRGGQYEDFVDNIQPFLEKQLKFDRARLRQ